MHRLYIAMISAAVLLAALTWAQPKPQANAERQLSAATEELINDRIQDELRTLRPQITSELRQQVKSELRQEIVSELREQLKSSLKYELRQELKSELKSELLQELRR